MKNGLSEKDVCPAQLYFTELSKGELSVKDVQLKGGKGGGDLRRRAALQAWLTMNRLALPSICLLP